MINNPTITYKPPIHSKTQEQVHESPGKNEREDEELNEALKMSMMIEE